MPNRAVVTLDVGVMLGLAGLDELDAMAMPRFSARIEVEVGESNVVRRRLETPCNLGNRLCDPVQFVIIRSSSSGSSHFPATATHRAISACSSGSSAHT